jgi:nucleoside-diphosphate-sugar epimerase
MTSNNLALILGITGDYGFTMARALQARGHRLRALVRDLGRAHHAVQRLDGPVELVQGDVLDGAALRRAMSGVGAVVHGVNAPYPRWDPFVVEAACAIAKATSEARATLLFPGNVYNFAASDDIREDDPQLPPSRKGRMRVEIERILGTVPEAGGQLIVLRGGDFFGQGGTSTWMNEMTKPLHKGRVILPGPSDLRHQWAYLPDFASAHAQLLERRHELPPAAFFHFQGHVVTGHGLVRALAEAAGRPTLRARSLPWLALKAGGIVLPMLREIGEMRYLWEQEVLMNGERLHSTLPDLTRTPLVEALRGELAARWGRTPNAAAADSHLAA